MPRNQITLFWKEIDLIQQRHASFFSPGQRDFITIKKIDNVYTLEFSEGYNLSTNITLEIQLAFKLTMT